MNELLKQETYCANEFVGARYKLNASDIDLLCRIIHAVNVTQYAQITFDLHALGELYGSTNGSRYRQLRESFANLMRSPIEIWDYTTKSYVLANVVSGVKINTQQGKVLVNIDQFMLPYLCDLKKHYTQFNLRSVLSMNTTYGKRLYLMCSQFKSSGTMSLTLDEMRDRLRLYTGTGDDRRQLYNDFSDLRKRVLEVAVEDINRHSELRVSYEAEKEGRGFNLLKWSIAVKAEIIAQLGSEQQRNKLKQYGLADWQIDNVFMTLQPEEIHPILYNISLNARDIKNKGAYLWATFTNTHKVPTHKLVKQYSLHEEIEAAQGHNNAGEAQRQQP
jgi:plasmid replication initiation protein